MLISKRFFAVFSLVSLFSACGSVRLYQPEVVFHQNRIVYTTDASVVVWDLVAKKSVWILPNQTITTRALFSPQGDKIIIWDPNAEKGEDTGIKIYDATTYVKIKEIHTTTGPVSVCAFSPDGKWVIAATTEPYELQLWDIISGTKLKSLKGHTDWIKSVAFFHTGQQLVSASQDKTIRIWDLNTQQSKNLPQQEQAPIMAVPSPDGKTVLASYYKDSKKNKPTVLLWDLKNNILKKQVFSQRGHGIFSPTGQQIALVAEELQLLDAKSLRPLCKFVSPSKKELSLYNVQFSMDGQRLIATDTRLDRDLVLDTKTCQQVDSFPHNLPYFRSVSVWKDKMAIARSDNYVEIHSLAKNNEVQNVIDATNMSIRDISFPNGGNQLLLTGHDHSAKMIDLATNKVMGEVAHLMYGGVVGTENSEDLFFINRANKIPWLWKWQIAANKLESLPREPAVSLNFSTTGSKKWDLSRDGRIWVQIDDTIKGSKDDPVVFHAIETKTGKVLCSLSKQGGALHALDLSTNGKWAVVYSYLSQSAGLLIDVEACKVKQNLLTGYDVKFIQFQPQQANYLLMLTEDLHVYLWDIAAKKVVFGAKEDNLSANDLQSIGWLNEHQFFALGHAVLRMWDVNGSSIGSIQSPALQGPIPTYHTIDVSSLAKQAPVVASPVSMAVDKGRKAKPPKSSALKARTPKKANKRRK